MYAVQHFISAYISTEALINHLTVGLSSESANVRNTSSRMLIVIVNQVKSLNKTSITKVGTM